MKSSVKTKAVTFVLISGILSSALFSACGGKKDSIGNENPDPSTTTSTTAPVVNTDKRSYDTVSLSSISSFGLDEVVMKDDYCVNALDKEIDYLTSFDTDKLLAGFRETAGLDMNGAVRYGGWENSLIGGHTMGHYLSALAQAYANAGVSDADREKISSIINTIIDELLICQENSKGKPGFIFGATLADKNNVEIQFDNVEKGLTNISSQAWVPWYTMHKILAGVIEVYELTGNENALTLAKGLGDWTADRALSWTPQVKNVVLSIEYGGMNDALYELYAITGEDRYAEAAACFDELPLFNRVKNGYENALNDLHANTTIPKFLGALNGYVTTNGKTVNGETVDASAYLEYAEAFWDMVVNKHSYVTGGNSEWEHFGKDEILDSERTNANNETCNVYNMLKLSRMLFEITGDRKYADYYENAYINTILSSQNPETGMTTYFQPMATGYFKVYSTEFTNFWCCTGSGMENFTKLNDSIYFHNDENLIVNLYYSSELSWKDKDLKLSADADLTKSSTVSFTLDSVSGADELDLNLLLRLPDWSDETGISVKLNGEDVEYSVNDGYIAILGGFASGSTVTVDLPMSLKVFSLPDNEAALAFKYGPFVLSADLGEEDETTTTTGVNVTVPAKKLVESETFTLNDDLSREDFIKNINDYLIKNDDMSFTLADTDITFGIHYLRYKERYGIYFYYKTKEEVETEANAGKRSDDEIIDTIQPGYGQYENDELHSMTETDTIGVTNDGTYRYANAGGSFTYRISVNKDGHNYLSLTLRKEDNGKPLRISAGASDTALTEIFNDTLDYIGKEDSYELRVEIPEDIINAAQTVTANDEEHDVIYISFTGNDSAESAKVCEFIYMLDVTKLYTSDPAVAYFVDCGDYVTYTVSDGDAFGVYNSLTEQLYGYDPVTGKKWGLIDDANDQYGGEGTGNGGLYTAHTWAYEFNEPGDHPRDQSNRYTKNQYEDGINPRYLDYAFELPNGEYDVEIGFSNPWNCSNLHDVYFNYGKDNEELAAASLNVSSGVLNAKASVTDGILTVNFRNGTSSGLAINVSYIKISFTA